MNRKIRIASALVLGSFLCACAPTAVFAASPLLSGYGGPGTGEQAIIGSTLIKGPGAGAGSGGSSGSTLSRSTSASESIAVGTGEEGAATGPTATVRSAEGRAPSGSHARLRGSSKVERTGSGQAAGGGGKASAFVYPSALRAASADSSMPVISGGDILVLAAMIATLSLLGVLTIRLGRLQG